MSDDIGFGRTVSYAHGEAPPLDADEVKPATEEAYYWQAGRNPEGEDSGYCHGEDRRPGHGASPDGRWACTRAPHHTGPHIAQLMDGRVVAIWSDQ